MTATAFEFRHRSLIFTGMFVASCAFYAFGDTNLALALLPSLEPALSPGAAARVLFGLGALSALQCALLRTWAAAYLDTRVVHDRELHDSRLVADGPYRHVRNPLYLGTILLAAGFAPIATRVGACLLMIGVGVLVYRLILREESELSRSQGERFRAYCRAVPRLLPSLVAKLPPSGLAPRWRQALAGEVFMWAFFLTLFTFALTLNPQAIRFGMALALGSSVAVKAVVWRSPGNKASPLDTGDSRL